MLPYKLIPNQMTWRNCIHYSLWDIMLHINKFKDSGMHWSKSKIICLTLSNTPFPKYFWVERLSLLYVYWFGAIFVCSFVWLLLFNNYEQSTLFRILLQIYSFEDLVSFSKYRNRKAHGKSCIAGCLFDILTFLTM